jgi:hypothetical protein
MISVKQVMLKRSGKVLNAVCNTCNATLHTYDYQIMVVFNQKWFYSFVRYTSRCLTSF